MSIGIDWRQKSTIRGAIWFIGGVIATGLVVAGNESGAMAVMTITGTVAGGVGVAVKD